MFEVYYIYCIHFIIDLFPKKFSQVRGRTFPIHLAWSWCQRRVRVHELHRFSVFGNSNSDVYVFFRWTFYRFFSKSSIISSFVEFKFSSLKTSLKILMCSFWRNSQIKYPLEISRDNIRMHADKHVLFKINKLATVQVGAPLRVQTECYNYASGLFCQNFLTSSQHLKKKVFWKVLECGRSFTQLLRKLSSVSQDQK